MVLLATLPTSRIRVSEVLAFVPAHLCLPGSTYSPESMPAVTRMATIILYPRPGPFFFRAPKFPFLLSRSHAQLLHEFLAPLALRAASSVPPVSRRPSPLHLALHPARWDSGRLTWRAIVALLSRPRRYRSPPRLLSRPSLDVANRIPLCGCCCSPPLTVLSQPCDCCNGA